MGDPKLGESTDGKQMHYSVGALIERDGKYLLIDRVKPPLGFAGVAGHIDEGENAIESLIREVEEESGLRVRSQRLLFEEEVDWNSCSKGIGVHYWYLFECGVDGDIRRNELETKSIDWYSKEDLAKLTLEPVWDYWFKKLGIV